MRRLHTREAWLGLACFLVLGAAGCQSVARKTSLQAPKGPSQEGDLGTSDPKGYAQGPLGPKQQANAHLDLGRVFEVQGNFDAAVAEYQKAVEACDQPGPHLGDARATKQQKALAERRMGGALDRLGRFAQAEVHYRKALEHNPGDVNVWNDAGYSYYLQSRWGDAERCLRQAALIEPDNHRVQTNLGLALAAQGKIDAALEFLTRASNPAYAHANLGYILASLGKNDEARKQYQQALELQPQFEAARFALASLEAGGSGRSGGPASGAPGAMVPVQTALSPTPITPTSSATVVVPSAPAPAPAPQPAQPAPSLGAAPIVVPTPVTVVPAGGTSPALAGPARNAMPTAAAAAAAVAPTPRPVATAPAPVSWTPAPSAAAPAPRPVATVRAPAPVSWTPSQPASAAAPRRVATAPAPGAQAAAARRRRAALVVSGPDLSQTNVTAPKQVVTLRAPTGLGELAPMGPPPDHDALTASALTGIPLPSTPAAQAGSADQDLQRASASAGIPLPNRPAPPSP